MILGLVLFLGAHTLTTQRESARAADRSMGDGTYKIGYSLVSAVGPCADRLGLCQISRDRLDRRLESPVAMRHSRRR